MKWPELASGSIKSSPIHLKTLAYGPCDTGVGTPPPRPWGDRTACAGPQSEALTPGWLWEGLRAPLTLWARSFFAGEGGCPVYLYPWTPGAPPSPMVTAKRVSNMATCPLGGRITSRGNHWVKGSSSALEGSRSAIIHIGVIFACGSSGIEGTIFRWLQILFKPFPPDMNRGRNLGGPNSPHLQKGPRGCSSHRACATLAPCIHAPHTHTRMWTRSWSLEKRLVASLGGWLLTSDTCHLAPTGSLPAPSHPHLHCTDPASPPPLRPPAPLSSRPSPGRGPRGQPGGALHLT